jgi:hypothetical protein
MQTSPMIASSGRCTSAALGVSRLGLRSAPARLLRQPGEEVSHLLRFPAPHGAPTSVPEQAVRIGCQQLGDELPRAGMGAHGDRREAQADRPALGLPGEALRRFPAGCRNRPGRPRQQPRVPPPPTTPEPWFYPRQEGRSRQLADTTGYPGRICWLPGTGTCLLGNMDHLRTSPSFPGQLPDARPSLEITRRDTGRTTGAGRQPVCGNGCGRDCSSRVIKPGHSLYRADGRPPGASLQSW